METQGGSRGCTGARLRTSSVARYNCCMYSSLATEEPCLAARIRYIHRVITRRYDEALRDSGLTVAQLDLLMTIAQAGDVVDQVKLGRWLAMDRSTVTRSVQRLERAGLVTTSPGATGRERRVGLTDAGAAATQTALPGWRRAQSAVRTLLGDSGVAALELLYDTITIAPWEDIDGSLRARSVHG